MTLTLLAIDDNMASNRFLSCVNDALFVEFSSQQLSIMSYLVLNIKSMLRSLLWSVLVCSFRKLVKNYWVINNYLLRWYRDIA